ncbi:putative alpha-1,2-mannosyltransferase [Aspergillus taichungensis]|uniref:Putative alpha-1,2-mannosyltransferase n=1 Tax=Aspergillus taichungensis TaxID=482145 RepID=A0A2J5HMR9_9EURO|nr:putative alpha-1,2-mannosyltransferase [Aspergillus taichungensis]
MVVFRSNKLRNIFYAVTALIVVCTIYLNWTPTPASVVPVTVFEVPLNERQAAFWKAFKPILESHAPGTSEPTLREPAAAQYFNASTTEPRPDLVTLSDDDLHAMEEAHAKYLREVSASSRLRPVHSAGTRGLVTTAGQTYLPVFMAALRMLRRTGSTLPVEVYMRDGGEYEKHICEHILPTMGARCLILSDVMSKAAIEYYQLKVFAVLFSSFEEVIWMDADCFALDKPEILFKNEPFKSKGLVTWPDFWASSVSPLYYKISGQPVPPMTERQSTETGVFLVSKKTHWDTLLLAAYYNFYGPSHYFQLLSQGGPSNGDKETLLHAASAVGKPFYAVSERVQAIGHEKEGEILGSAMAQSDPLADHALTSEGKWRVQDPAVASPPRVFFIHANYPKFNPGEDVFGTSFETTPTIKPDGSEGRAWTAPADVLTRFGSDAERSYWEEIKWVSCNKEVDFKAWKGKGDVCSNVEHYWQKVFAEPHDDDPKFVAD